MSSIRAFTFVPTTNTNESHCGSVVDIGTLHTALKVRVVLTDSCGAESEIRVHTSSDGVAWRVHTCFCPKHESVGEIVVVDVDRYVKIEWHVDGCPETTIAVTGTAHQLYANQKDMVALSLGPSVFLDADWQLVNRTLLHGSDVAAGYLNSRFKLPLLRWYADLAGHTAAVSAYRFMVSRGFAPEGHDSQVRMIFDDAIRWFERVAKGEIVPTDIEDSSPHVDVGKVIITTHRRRGW